MFALHGCPSFPDAHGAVLALAAERLDIDTLG
jgi:hypothetical protein